MKELNLTTMSVDDLFTLRDRVMKMLSTRVETERHQLEARLTRLQNVELSGSQRPFARGYDTLSGRAKVAAKFINPANSSESWSGRGRRPLWLAVAIKRGKKLSDFQNNGAARVILRRRRKRRTKSK